MKDNEQPDWLRHHLDTLADEVDPSRDLWPGVAQRLKERSRARPGYLAIAAVLLASAGFSLFGWQAYRAAESERAATAAMIVALLAPYEQSRTETDARWLALGNRIDPATMAILNAERANLENARATLIEALHTAPTDPALHQLMQQVTAREADLFESGTMISGYTL